MNPQETDIEHRYEALKRKAFADAPELTVTELVALQATTGKRVLLCDVRTDAEFAVSTLPGARLRAELEADLTAARGDADTTVVCFCTIGARSGAATLALRRQGINALNLRGSVLAWTHAGGELVEPATGQPTRRVHTYAADWSLQAPGYEAVVFERPPHARTLLSLVRDKARALFGA
jgi:rhodanese-related sulfurtransferase